jgi:hypothetical protein
MRRTLLVAFLLAVIGLVGGFAQTPSASVDVSGTWAFSVDLDSGAHGDPTFVFKQDKEKLTGTYDGPLGKYEVTGTVKDNKVVFGFEFTRESNKLKATYTGAIESATKMSGTMAITDGGPTGKWTATKK